MAVTTQGDKCIDMRWMPKDCDGQIKMGFSIIANAFKSKVKSLEEDLLAANKERSEQEEKIAALQSRLVKLQREHLESSLLQSRLAEIEEKLIEKTVELETASAEHNKREQDLLNDNRRLAEHVRLYKKKASQLETFRRVVVDSIKHEEDMDSVEISDKTVNHSLASSNTTAFPCNGQRTAIGEFPVSHIQTGSTETNSQCDSQGRRLFRNARAKLSVDQFERFLENVRQLNSHAISADQALMEAEKICGFEHVMIYEELKNLLYRKGNSPSPHPVVNILGSPMSH